MSTILIIDVMKTVRTLDADVLQILLSLSKNEKNLIVWVISTCSTFDFSNKEGDVWNFTVHYNLYHSCGISTTALFAAASIIFRSLLPLLLLCISQYHHIRICVHTYEQNNVITISTFR